MKQKPATAKLPLLVGIITFALGVGILFIPDFMGIGNWW